MNLYELMVIVTPQLKESEAEKTSVKLVKEHLKEFSAEITWKDFWGARGFAYIIKKQRWGYYLVVRFNMEGSKASALRNELNLDNQILRFLLTRVDPKAPEPRPYKELKAEWDAQEKAKNAEKKSAPNTSPLTETLTTVPVAVAAEGKKEQEPQKKEEKAPSKDAIDKKLDAILADSSSDL